MQRTPLITHHQACGAKLVDFAGWEMPIQYSGVVDEYHTVRSHVGLFDVSHMGRVRIAGAGAVSFLQRITTNDVGKLAVSQAQYSMVCNENGGIKDDVFVYRLTSDEFLLCVNASNREKILSWLQFQLAQDKTIRLEDRSVELSQVAVQGPKSRELLMSLGGTALEGLKLHHTCDGTIGGLSCLLARTGYTGELGYEMYIDADKVGRLWDLLVDKGQAWGLKPAGLGARDLLRLEMGYLLYGNDMGEETTPLEANADWTVSFQKGGFIGSQALLADDLALQRLQHFAHLPLLFDLAIHDAARLAQVRRHLHERILKLRELQVRDVLLHRRRQIAVSDPLTLRASIAREQRPTFDRSIFGLGLTARF